jgi:hypothetical protein
MKSVRLNLLEPYGSVWACTAIALPLPLQNLEKYQFSSKRPGFDTGSVSVRSVLQELTMKEEFPPALNVSPVSIISLLLHTRLHINGIIG